MAKKISELTAYTTPQDNDLFVTVDIASGLAGTKNITWAVVKSRLQSVLNFLVPNTPITGATKTKITYDADGLVTAGADATTIDIADSTNKRYVTDAQLVVIGNTSGTNTGDQTLGSLGAEAVANKVTSISDSSTDVQYPSAKAVNTSLDLKATQFPGICAETPISINDISINYTTRVLTINRTGGFHYFTDGNGVITKHVVTGSVSFPAFTDTSGIWNFYFDNTGTPTVAQGTPPSFDTVAMVYRLLWNATLTGSAKSAVEAYECHDNTTSGIDHTWKHEYGTINKKGTGNCVDNRLSSGTPNADGRNAVIALTTLSNLDDNLPYTVTNSTGGLKFQQDMGNITAASLNATNSGLFKVRVQDAGGLISYLPVSRFPFAFNASNTPEFITSTGTRTNVSAGNFFVYYIYSIQDPRNGEAVKSVSEIVQYNTLTLAQASSWSNLQAVYTILNDGEIRPLYKLIYQYSTSYDVGTKKSVLREVQDIRVQRVTATSAIGSVLATSVVNVPAGNIASTNVQDAINELDTEKAKVGLATASGLTMNTGKVLARSTASVGAIEEIDFSAASTANSIVRRDANKNILGNNIIGDYTTIATAGGSTTLTVSSTYQQRFTGTLNQTVVLPVATTLANGMEWQISNDSTGLITVNTSGGNTLIVIPSGGTAFPLCKNIAGGTGTASWAISYEIGLSTKDTLTNKRIQPRVTSTTSASSVTPDLSSASLYIFTAQAVGFTINAPTGTPIAGETFEIVLVTAVAQSLTWNAIYKGGGVALPTTTVAGKIMTITCQYIDSSNVIVHYSSTV